MFGPHLTLDLYGCSEERISSSDLITEILDELPKLINMRTISEPQVIVYPGKNSSFDKGGISAFVLIAESHISIHTFKGYGFATVDVFSCKNFSVEKTEKYFIEKLEAKKVEKHFIMRGREFPRDVSKAAKIVLKNRKNRV